MLITAEQSFGVLSLTRAQVMGERGVVGEISLYNASIFTQKLLVIILNFAQAFYMILRDA